VRSVASPCVAVAPLFFFFRVWLCDGCCWERGQANVSGGAELMLWECVTLARRLFNTFFSWFVFLAAQRAHHRWALTWTTSISARDVAQTPTVM
jgi:hypothetical protein